MLTADDLKLLMGWKLGEVDHKLSERSITFRNDWRDHLISRGQYGAKDFSTGITYLGQNTKTFEGKAASDIFESLATARSQLPNFGPVYWLTIIYFAKRGQWPIFDKFAWIASSCNFGRCNGGYWNP